MSRERKLKHLSRLVAARATACERELAKASQTVIERTAQAKEQRKLWTEAEAETKTYVADRFETVSETEHASQFFQSLATGHEEKRRQTTIARLKAEQQSVKAGEAVKERLAQAKRFLAINRRQDGLQNVLTKLHKAQDQAQQLQEEDALQDMAPRKDAHGTA